jgi:hypothetical protein
MSLVALRRRLDREGGADKISIGGATSGLFLTGVTLRANDHETSESEEFSLGA